MTTLIVKELKERKTVIFIGIISCLTPAVYAMIAHILKDRNLIALIFPIAFLLLINIIIALPIMIAEASIAGEVEGKTLSFLLSLPISRKKLWCAKITSCFLILYGTLSIYLTLTYFLFASAKMKSPDLDVACLIIAVILLVPSIILTIAFLTSTVASKTMTASVGALLMVFIIAFGALYLLNGLEWTISLAEFILLASAVSFVAAMTSRFIFEKAEFMDDAKKLKTALKCFTGGLIAIVALTGAIYAFSYFFLSSQALCFDTIIPEPGSGRLLTSVQCRGFQNYRMWMLDPSNKKTLKFKERRIFAPIFVDKETIQFEKIKAYDLIFKGRVNLQHWLMDARGQNRRLLHSSVMDMKSLGNFFSKGSSQGSGSDRLFFILPWKEANYISLDITLLTKNGGRVRDIRLPEKIDSGTSVYDDSGYSEKGRKIELQHRIRDGHDLLSLFFPYRETSGDLAMALDEIDLMSGKYSRISGIILDRDELCPAYELSGETGDCMAIVKKRNTWRILRLPGGSKEGKWETLFETDNGPLLFPHFLHDGKSLLWVEKKRGNSQKISILDLRTKSIRTFDETDLIYGLFLSPDAKRMVFVTSPRATESSPLCLKVKDLDSEGPPRPIAGVTFQKREQWTITWRDSSELIYHIRPWHIGSITFSPEGERVKRLYPYEEEK
jgi:ABC-type transport system involved in multi-copper enzyme maturation permease subunit